VTRCGGGFGMVPGQGRHSPQGVRGAHGYAPGAAVVGGGAYGGCLVGPGIAGNHHVITKAPHSTHHPAISSQSPWAIPLEYSRGVVRQEVCVQFRF